MSLYQTDADHRWPPPVPTRGRHRIALVVVGVISALTFGASAQQPPSDSRVVTEQEAVDRAVERRDRTRVWQARVDARRAEARTQGAWPNPEIGYTREQTTENGQVMADDFVTLRQTLPLSGQRGLRAEATRTHAEAVRLQTESERRRVALRVRRAFYRLLYTQKRLEVFDAWLERMRQVEETLRARVQAGESAPYAVERLRREIADGRSDRQAARARLLHHRAELAGLVGLSPDETTLAADGQLMPDTLPTRSELDRGVDRRPELEALDKRIEAARLGERAAGRWWVPEPTLTGGYRRVTSGPQHFHGFIAGLSLSLPLLDRQSGARRAAEAERVQAEYRQTLVERRLRSRAYALIARAEQMRRAAGDYRSDGLERARRLRKTARRAYKNGEVGILELIDAHRGAVDARLRLLELTLETRMTEIRLRQTIDAAADTNAATGGP